MLLVDHEFTLEVDELAVLLHGPHYRSHDVIDVLLTRYLVVETQWRFNLVHQEYQILQIDPASCLTIELQPIVDKVMIMFLRHHARMLLIR